MRLRDKVAVITGAASGIGKGIAIIRRKNRCRFCSGAPACCAAGDRDLHRRRLLGILR